MVTLFSKDEVSIINFFMNFSFKNNRHNADDFYYILVQSAGFAKIHDSYSWMVSDVFNQCVKRGRQPD